MTDTFARYAEYYDLLYKDKDYHQEVEYIHGLIQEYQPYAKSILELGCGTGKHAILLHEKGYNIHGIDLSDTMVEKARTLLDKENNNDIQFMQGDIRTIQLNQTFDVVISLFHVMSYQTQNKDILNAFLTASAHLKPGGLFIFDCWYGPGVLSDPPETRVKKFEDEKLQITRIAQPVSHIEDNLVEVNYELFINDKIEQQFYKINEQHLMRYFFKMELLLLFERTGLKLKNIYSFLKKSAPNKTDWNALFICEKGRA